MRKVFQIIFFIFLLLSSLHLEAQQQWKNLKFKRFAADQGLTVTTAFSIIQDDNGFLWIATIDGLQRYDGYNFIRYKNNISDTNSISDNTVSTLAKGKNNVIWVGTFGGGLNCFDVKTGKFKHYQNIPGNENSLSSNRVWAITVDKNGNVWTGTENGLNKIDVSTGRITRFFHENGNKNSICGNTILSILENKSGNIWIGTTDGLGRVEENTSGYVFQNFKNEKGNLNSLSNDIVMSVFETKSGEILAGTTDGLCKFIPETNSFKEYRFSSKKNDTESKSIYSYLNSYGENATRAIYEDQYGNLWLSTDLGLKILNPKTGEFISYRSDAINPNSLSTDLLYGMCEDLSGNIWIGSMTGGLNKANLKLEKFALIQTQNENPHNLSKNNIRALFSDSKGAVWAGTMGGGVNEMKKGATKFLQPPIKEILTENVWAIFEDKQGEMWFGTSAGLFKYNRENGNYKKYSFNASDENSISSNIVRKIFSDSKGNLWVGTEGGLNKFDYVTEKFTRFLKDDKNKNSLSSNVVWCITETEEAIWVGTDNGLNKIENEKTFTQYFPEKGNKNSLCHKSVRFIWKDAGGILWIGTSNGLNKFNPKTNEFKQYNEAQGLANSYIYGVLEDKKRNLWISTNNGISKFNKQTEEFRNYNKLDGLQNNEFNTGGFCVSPEGEMFFGGPDGFNRFFPDSIKENTTPPKIIMTSIKIFGNELANEFQPYEIKNIVLAYDENAVSFEFTAADFTLPEKNQYSFKMDGFDMDWVKSGTRRFASYTNLDPGDYVFRVRASNNDGVWNEKGIEIYITVTPPFWATWWFRISVLCIIVVGVYGLFKWRLQRLRAIQKYLEEQVNLKTKELRAEKELVEVQNKVIEKKNQNITSSIKYAKRIQDSILPKKEKIAEVVGDAFILFKPKDIVSGDFYWFARVNGISLVAAVDCTGHGVPGAFMSLIGNNLLNDIVNNLKITDPQVILHKLHDGVVNALKKHEHETGTVDGMDIALCAIDAKNKMLEFASSGRPLVLVNSTGLRNFSAKKHPVGLITNKEVKFEKKIIYLGEQESFYIFTDGYCDQFGGPDDDKFMETQFETVIQSIRDEPMAEQEKILEKKINDWRGSNAQIDDILVIGIKCL